MKQTNYWFVMATVKCSFYLMMQTRLDIDEN